MTTHNTALVDEYTYIIRTLGTSYTTLVLSTIYHLVTSQLEQATESQASIHSLWICWEDMQMLGSD